MTEFTDVLDYSSGKTRVLIFTSNESLAKVILQLLHEAGKNVDFFLNGGAVRKEDHDFVIFETSDCYRAAQFEPNIMFVSTEMSAEILQKILPKITPGGSLIFPENLEAALENQPNYFRKLPYSTAVVQKSDKYFYPSFSLGQIPLSGGDPDLAKNIVGIQLLCQQFGVQEADFCEYLVL